MDLEDFFFWTYIVLLWIMKIAFLYVLPVLVIVFGFVWELGFFIFGIIFITVHAMVYLGLIGYPYIRYQIYFTQLMRKTLKKIDVSNLTPLKKRTIKNFKRLIFSNVILAINTFSMSSFCAFLEWSVKKFNENPDFDIITEFVKLNAVSTVLMQERMTQIQELKKQYRRDEIGLDDIEQSDIQFLEKIAHNTPGFTVNDVLTIFSDYSQKHNKKLTSIKNAGTSILWISGGVIGTVLGILFAIYIPNLALNSIFRLAFSSVVGFFLFDKFLSLILVAMGQSMEMDLVVLQMQFWKKYKLVLFEIFRVILFFLSIFFVLYRWNSTISIQQLWILLIFGLFGYVFPIIIFQFVNTNIILINSGLLIRLLPPKNLWNKVTYRVESKTLWLFFLITFILLSLDISIWGLSNIETPLLIASLAAIVFLILPSIYLIRGLNNGFPDLILQRRINLLNYGFYLLFFFYTFLSIIYVIISDFIPEQSLFVEILQDIGIFALIGSSFLALYSMFYRRGCTKLQETYLWIVGQVRNDVYQLRNSQSYSYKTEILSLLEKNRYHLLQEKCAILINEFSTIRSKQFKVIWDTWIDLKLVPFDLIKKQDLTSEEFTELQEFHQRVTITQSSFGRTSKYKTMYELQRLKKVEQIHESIEQNVHQLQLTGAPNQNLNEVLTLYDEVFNQYEKDLIPIQKNERTNFWVIVLKFVVSLVIPVVLNMIVIPLLISVF